MAARLGACAAHRSTSWSTIWSSVGKCTQFVDPTLNNIRIIRFTHTRAYSHFNIRNNDLNTIRVQTSLYDQLNSCAFGTTISELEVFGCSFVTVSISKQIYLWWIIYYLFYWVIDTWFDDNCWKLLIQILNQLGSLFTY